MPVQVSWKNKKGTTWFGFLVCMWGGTKSSHANIGMFIKAFVAGETRWWWRRCNAVSSWATGLQELNTSRIASRATDQTLLWVCRQQPLRSGWWWRGQVVVFEFSRRDRSFSGLFARSERSMKNSRSTWWCCCLLRFDCLRQQWEFRILSAMHNRIWKNRK